MPVDERVKEIVKWLVFQNYSKSEAELAKKLGYTKSHLSQIVNGKVTVSDKFINKLIIFCDIINRNWILTGDGEMINRSDVKKNTVKSNADKAKDKETFDVPLIGQYAYAGYLSGFSDPEYMEKQPTYTVKYDHNGGNYIAFEVRGDSMDDDTRRSICSGDIVLGCELKKDYWIDNLIVPKVFVIVHRENGIVIKEVIAIDKDIGVITCHSWNSSPEYRDFEIHLKDVQQMFYIKEINRNVKY